MYGEWTLPYPRSGRGPRPAIRGPVQVLSAERNPDQYLLENR